MQAAHQRRKRVQQRRRQLQRADAGGAIVAGHRCPHFLGKLKDAGEDAEALEGLRREHRVRARHAAGELDADALARDLFLEGGQDLQGTANPGLMLNARTESPRFGLSDRVTRATARRVSACRSGGCSGVQCMHLVVAWTRTGGWALQRGRRGSAPRGCGRPPSGRLSWRTRSATQSARRAALGVGLHEATRPWCVRTCKAHFKIDSLWCEPLPALSTVRS